MSDYFCNSLNWWLLYVQTRAVFMWIWTELKRRKVVRQWISLKDRSCERSDSGASPLNRSGRRRERSDSGASPLNRSGRSCERSDSGASPLNRSGCSCERSGSGASPLNRSGRSCERSGSWASPLNRSGGNVRRVPQRTFVSWTRFPFICLPRFKNGVKIRVKFKVGF